MNELVKLGFKRVGKWKFTGSRFEFELDDRGQHNNALYSFVVNGSIKYIGKTTQSLFVRLKGYQNPGKSQVTNIRVNKCIIEAIQKGFSVDIYALFDSGLLKYGDIAINLPAAIEDGIVKSSSPEWNDHGKMKGEPQVSAVINSNKKGNLAANNGDVYYLTLHKAYYNSGFFNVIREYSELIGPHNKAIEIHVEGENTTILGRINRTANLNSTPRIMGTHFLKKWFQKFFSIGDILMVTFSTPTSITLKRYKTQVAAQ